MYQPNYGYQYPYYGAQPTMADNLAQLRMNTNQMQNAVVQPSMPSQPMPLQSYSAPPMEQVETYIETTGDSEFLKAVNGRKSERLWKLIDELVEAVKILHPRMYTTFIDKVQDL